MKQGLAESPSDKKSQSYTVVALGDSLTEGYGIEKEMAYPKLVEDKFKEENIDVKMVNAGISGSTSSSALSRMRWFLRMKPDVLLLALGANDGLRGVPITTTKENLKNTVKLARENNIQVLLMGMKLPPNYGPQYRTDFEKMYSEIAAEEKLAFLPFFLDGVAGVKELNLPDGIHPNEKGHVKLAEAVFKFVKAHLPEKQP